MEPMEHVVIDVPDGISGQCHAKAWAARKGELDADGSLMSTTRMRMEFRMPSRGLFGYRSEFLTDTHGEGILNTIFDGYDEWRGDLSRPAAPAASSAMRPATAVAYGLFNAQQRGTLIVNAGRQGLRGRWSSATAPTGEDITVNVCKTKHLTNTRASGSDDALRLVPVSKFSLEGSLEFLKPPTSFWKLHPSSLRIRKRILNHDLRMKAASKKNK